MQFPNTTQVKQDLNSYQSAELSCSVLKNNLSLQADTSLIISANLGHIDATNCGQY